MKAKDIVVGGRYIARVSGKFVAVRVDAIRYDLRASGAYRRRYYVTNLDTGRKLMFSSSSRFHGIAEAAGH